MNTKHYLFIPLFKPGGAAPSDSIDLEHIHQACWRAAMLCEHRIAIDAYESRGDPRELGAAALRVDFLRSSMVAEGVLEERIEARIHIVDENAGEFDRRAEIRLLPASF